MLNIQNKIDVVLLPTPTRWRGKAYRSL